MSRVFVHVLAGNHGSCRVVAGLEGGELEAALEGTAVGLRLRTRTALSLGRSVLQALSL